MLGLIALRGVGVNKNVAHLQHSDLDPKVLGFLQDEFWEIILRSL